MVGLILVVRVLAGTLDAVYALSQGLDECCRDKLTFDNITKEEAELLVARLGGISVCFHTLRRVRELYMHMLRSRAADIGAW
jgi:hypothetical protein